jgi:hypothetical protein
VVTRVASPILVALVFAFLAGSAVRAEPPIALRGAAAAQERDSARHDPGVDAHQRGADAHQHVSAAHERIEGVEEMGGHSDDTVSISKEGTMSGHSHEGMMGGRKGGISSDGMQGAMR